MPTCSRCKVVFGDDEVHECEGLSRRVVKLWSLIIVAVVLYAVVAFDQGGLVNPGSVAVYLFMLIASTVARLLHLLVDFLRLPGM